MTKVLMKGNEAIAKAAIAAGCECFFGYPITPQNELIEYIAKYLWDNGGHFVQAESEIAAINMVYGAAATGARVMTSSSSPGIALKQEGISYCAGAELPAVIISISRGGPGLGGILPSQADYHQATRGGGNGDYKVIVFAPNGVQESTDMVKEAFIIAEKYRNPVMIMADAMIGQMMEAVEIKEDQLGPIKGTWFADGHLENRAKNIVSSVLLDPHKLENHNIHLQKKYREIEKNEVRYELSGDQVSDVLIVAYGSSARISKAAMASLKDEGINVSLLRPQTLYPFPEKAIKDAAKGKKFVLVCELSMGQMVYDVEHAVMNSCPVYFYGRSGGVIFEPDEIVNEVKKHLKGAQ